MIPCSLALQTIKIATNVPSSDDKSRSEQTSPMLEVLRENRRKFPVQNTNFTEPEFLLLFEQVENDLNIHLRTGRGKIETSSAGSLLY